MPTLHLLTKGSHEVLMPAICLADTDHLACRQLKPVEVRPFWLHLPSLRCLSLAIPYQPSMGFFPFPRALPGAEAKMWPVLNLQLQLKLNRQLRNFQNFILILNLSMLLHWLRSLPLASQSKHQGNRHAWERINSGRVLNLHNFHADERHHG